MDGHQVTFVDNYTTVTRVLADEFGRGFSREGVYHHRDAPFVKRLSGSMPKNLTQAERAVLELHDAFILPSKAVSDAFVTAFFDRVHPVLPILDRGTFMKRYGNLTDFSVSACDSLLLLQGVLLSGSTVFQHPDLTEPPQDVSWRLLARAKSLVENRFEQDRLALVQAPLLFSTFVGDSCDDTLQNMWLSIPSAVRIAQGMGMHRSLAGGAGPAMRREWKRIWWTLVVHDTLCSFEWGQPRAICCLDSDVPKLVPHDFQSEEVGSIPNVEHVNLFIGLCKLCDIISRWLDLYRPGLSKPVVGDQQATLQRETGLLLLELLDWHATFPGIIQFPSVPTRGNVSLWACTLQITYQAALLRLSSQVSERASMVLPAATRIIDICEAMQHCGPLDSPWSFGSHELDLALCHQARLANSREKGTAAKGLRELRRGLPLLARLESKLRCQPRRCIL
jgi:hypothetical protein